MKRIPVRLTLWITLFGLILAPFVSAALREEDPNSGGHAGPARTDSTRPVETEMESDPEEAVSTEMIKSEGVEPAKPAPKKAEKKRIERADAFVAGPDWEFDGFVAGGQDQAIRTMFYQGDLIYLNIGSQQGVNPGDRVAIYKRGDRLKDPQTGKFIGYEVRRAAIAKASDRVDSETASVRITNTFEPVEIGDLAKRE